MIDKSVSPSVSDFFRNDLKENVYYVGKEIMPNRAAKERKRLRRKLAIQNKRRKREMKKARKNAITI